MIVKINGIVDEVGLQDITLMTNGLGYRVFMTTDSLVNVTIDDNLSLFTHHVIRENSQDLYGFKNREDLEFFELLLTISGIGPKSALSILNTASSATLKEGITSGDAGYLSKISGISKKNAEKIVLNLKDKIGSIESYSTNNTSESSMAIEALTSLGYSEKDSREAIQKVDKTLTTEKMIKEALKNLGK